MLLGFSHFSFSVSDIERSVRWYRDVLGMQLLGRQRQDNAYTRTIVGHDGAVLEVAELSAGPAGSGPQIALELIEYVQPRGERVRLDTPNVGVAHLSLVVADIAATHRRLTAAGVEFVSPPVRITEGVNRGGQACYFRDPDGITLELFQPRSPVEATPHHPPVDCAER